MKVLARPLETFIVLRDGMRPAIRLVLTKLQRVTHHFFVAKQKTNELTALRLLR